MTQAEIVTELMKRRFAGKWPVSVLAAHADLAPHTLRRAFDGDMSADTQARLTALFKAIPETYEPKKPSKGKLGKRKKTLMRYYNLKRWIAAIEGHHGKIARYRVEYHKAEHIKSGYATCKLDYILKRYLLEVFGEELRKKNVALGDCFSVEQWILRIEKALPNCHHDLIVKLQRRGK